VVKMMPVCWGRKLRPRLARGLLAVLVVLGAASPAALAQNVNGCSAYSPAAGSTVTCGSPFGPSTSGVQSPANNTGNNGVTVSVDATAQRSINGSTVGLGSGSTVVTAGRLNTQSFFFGYGISFGANGRSTLGGNTAIVTQTGRITTGGGNAHAIYIDSRSARSTANTVSNAGALQTAGTNAFGIFVTSRNSEAVITNSGSIAATGAGGSGIVAENTTNPISITNTATGSIAVSGSGASGILASGSATITNAGTVCTGTWSGGVCTVAPGTGSAIRLVAAAGSRSQVVNQSTGLIASAGALSVDTSAAAVDILNNGEIRSTGPTALDLTGDDALRGIGRISGGVINAGSIAPGTVDQIGTLTINGPYLGVNGTLTSRVGGPPAAPSADVLRISGNGFAATGTTAVSVVDIGGLGAPTRGDGILLIDAASGAQTGASAFALAGRAAAGAYEYNLIRGASSATEQNWYLATHEEPVVPDPEAPVIPDPEPDAQPSFRVETQAYTALPALQRLYTYALVDTLDLRRGATGAAVSGAAGADQTASWGRLGGSFGTTSAEDAGALDLSYNLGFLQVGIDVIATDDGQGGWMTSGGFLAIGQGYGTTSTDEGGETGSAVLDGYTAGLYGTWRAASGLYADALVQVTRFVDAGASSSGDQSVATDGWGQSLSLEAGVAMPAGGGVVLTPQGQIIVDNFWLDGASDAFGDVAFDNGTAARGRLGIEVQKVLEGDGTKTDLSLSADLWRVFADDPQTTFSTFDGANPVGFDAEIGNSWLALNAGFTTVLDEGLRLYGSVGYDYGLDDSRQAATGRLGLEARW